MMLAELSQRVAAVLEWCTSQGCTCDDDDVAPGNHYDFCAGHVEYLLTGDRP